MGALRRTCPVALLIVAIASCSASDNDPRIPADAPWSTRIADSFLLRHPGAVTYDSGFTEQKWNYEQGLMLWALYQTSLHTGQSRYMKFLVDNLSQYVEPDGGIRTYRRSDYNLDLVAPGRSLLVAWKETGKEKFRRAADTLREQLRHQPRTHEGGFWHKKIYPYQMWLDGLYMAEPFYAMYTQSFGPRDDLDDIANQFVWIARHARDSATGLYYHGWDESREQRWADSQTGCSPGFWGRAMGWYAMALVDVIEYFPEDHPRRKELVTIFDDVCKGLLGWRDPESHVWRLVLDQGDRTGNYLESSCSAMFTYAFAKGARMGYIDASYFDTAKESFEGILKHQVAIDPNGFVNLLHTIKGAGLGGTPYRDGSFDYYAGEAQRTNDMKGVGPFLLSAIEIERGMKK